MIDVEVGGGDLLHGIEDEVDDVVGGHPVAQIAGQEHRRLAVEIDETCGHAGLDPFRTLLFKSFSKIFRA